MNASYMIPTRVTLYVIVTKSAAKYGSTPCDFFETFLHLQANYFRWAWPLLSHSCSFPSYKCVRTRTSMSFSFPNSQSKSTKKERLVKPSQPSMHLQLLYSSPTMRRQLRQALILKPPSFFHQQHVYPNLLPFLDTYIQPITAQAGQLPYIGVYSMDFTWRSLRKRKKTLV